MPKRLEKTEVIKMRVTPEQKRAIYLQAQSKKLSMADYVRGTALPKN
jgi:uncharacterized protein (DUF1778 family)